MKQKQMKVWIVENGVSYNLCYPLSKIEYTGILLWYSLVVDSTGRLFIIVNALREQNHIRFHSKKYDGRLVKIMGEA